MAGADDSGVDDFAAAAARDAADATDGYLALICVQSSSYRRNFSQILHELQFRHDLRRWIDGGILDLWV